VNWEVKLEPSEYCRRWVEYPNEWGYRKACICALAKATGLSERTVNNWGATFERRPNYVLHVLKLADQLNQIKKILADHDLFSD
jgi:hypothetical protein